MKDQIQFLSFVILTQGIQIEKERIETIKSWLEPKLVKNIQILLGFINFYRRFIKNFGKITVSPTFIFQTTEKSICNKLQSTQANNNEKNQDISSGICDKDGDRNIEDLLSVMKLVKSEKSKLDYAIVNSSETGFLTLEAKKAFINL